MHPDERKRPRSRQAHLRWRSPAQRCAMSAASGTRTATISTWRRSSRTSLDDPAVGGLVVNCWRHHGHGESPPGGRSERAAVPGADREQPGGDHGPEHRRKRAFRRTSTLEHPWPGRRGDGGPSATLRRSSTRMMRQSAVRYPQSVLAEPGAVARCECRVRHRDGRWRSLEAVLTTCRTMRLWAASSLTCATSPISGKPKRHANFRRRASGRWPTRRRWV